jgi:ankyrin repeat protein
VLFAAADSGCLPLARRLLDAGASLAARDRLGAMALARAARAGHVALVDFLVARARRSTRAISPVRLRFTPRSRTSGRPALRCC